LREYLDGIDQPRDQAANEYQANCGTPRHCVWTVRTLAQSDKD
jgi:hypothetical protein